MMYIIKCIERNMWWKPNKRGYTANKNEAGRYTEKEANEIISQPYVTDTKHKVQ